MRGCQVQGVFPPHHGLPGITYKVSGWSVLESLTSIVPIIHQATVCFVYTLLIMKAFLTSLIGLCLVNAKPTKAGNNVCAATDFPPPVAVYDDIYATCANANWPPPGPGDNVGNVLKPQEPDRELQSALSEVSAERIKETISKLVSFGTRHTLSPQNDTQRGIGAARDWIASEFRRFAEESDGRMEVDVPGYIQSPTERIPEPVKISNVRATLKGVSDPDRYYVTMGHYDTRVSDPLNWWEDQPGANDDASGVAGM